MKVILLNVIKKSRSVFNKLFKKIILKKSKSYYERVQESVNWHRKNEDPKENKNTTIPKEEKVNLRCLWIFEVYTPNYINDLINNIDKLPWEKPLHLGLKHSEVIKRSREGKYYNWYNLGYVWSEKQNVTGNFLPEDIEYIHGSFFQYLPSISIIGIQFVFKSNVSDIIEEKLKTEYKTYVKKNERIYEFFSPVRQKRAEIKKLRKKVYDKCYKWFEKYLPGLYSDKTTDIEFPTCEFITLLKGKPYYKKKIALEDYIDILDLRNELDAWVCDDLNGIFLEFPTFTKTDFTKIKIAGNSSEILSDKDLKSYGGIKDHGIEHYMENFGHTLYIWVLSVLLNTYRFNLYRIRDSISSVSFKNIKKATIALQAIREKYALLVRNMTCFINEYKYLNRMPFSGEIYKFKPFKKFPFNKDIELFQNIFKKTRKETIYMAHEYLDIGKSIDTTANIILSVTNERLFKKSLVLQWIMIFLTILIFILTVFTFIEKWPFIKCFINSIKNL